MSPARSPLVLASAALALATAATVTVATAAGAAPGSTPVYGGSAYGSSAHLGQFVSSGRSAKVVACALHVGAVHRDHTARVTVPHLGTIGAVHTKLWSAKSHGAYSAFSTARTATTSLLMANVTAQAVSAKATVSRHDGKYRMVGQTTLVGLKLFGKSLPVHPKANQRVAIPGIGRLVLNHQVRSVSDGTHRISVTAVSLHLGGRNQLGLPSGDVVLSRANASMHRPIYRMAHGTAYASSVSLGNAVVSGRTAPAYLPCGGSNGRTVTNNTAAVKIKGLRTAVTKSTARSTDTGRRTAATLTARVAKLRLAGRISASAVVARASVTATRDGISRSSRGTDVVGLTIDGKRVDGSRPANTKYAIPGLGTLWIHRVVKSASGVKVYALELDIAKAGAGFEKGAVIRIAAVAASVHRR